MRNIRRRFRESRSHHEDFDWMKSADYVHIKSQPESKASLTKQWNKYYARLREGWDFAIVLWGTIGKQEDVSKDLSSKRMIIRDVSDHGKVREIMKEIDYDNLDNDWMGAPSIKPQDIIMKYEEKKQEWIQQNRIVTGKHLE